MKNFMKQGSILVDQEKRSKLNYDAFVSALDRYNHERSSPAAPTLMETVKDYSKRAVAILATVGNLALYSYCPAFAGVISQPPGQQIPAEEVLLPKPAIETIARKPVGFELYNPIERDNGLSYLEGSVWKNTGGQLIRGAGVAKLPDTFITNAAAEGGSNKDRDNVDNDMNWGGISLGNVSDKGSVILQGRHGQHDWQKDTATPTDIAHQEITKYHNTGMLKIDRSGYFAQAQVLNRHGEDTTRTDVIGFPVSVDTKVNTEDFATLLGAGIPIRDLTLGGFYERAVSRVTADLTTKNGANTTTRRILNQEFKVWELGGLAEYYSDPFSFYMEVSKIDGTNTPQKVAGSAFVIGRDRFTELGAYGGRDTNGNGSGGIVFSPSFSGRQRAKTNYSTERYLRACIDSTKDLGTFSFESDQIAMDRLNAFSDGSGIYVQAGFRESLGESGFDGRIVLPLRELMPAQFNHGDIRFVGQMYSSPKESEWSAGVRIPVGYGFWVGGTFHQSARLGQKINSWGASLRKTFGK